jgi:hypothetical protein
MMQLWQDSAASDGKYSPIVFIRFNPDGYTDHNGVKHPSCFGIHKSLGTYGLKSKYRNRWEQRLNALQETIRRHMKNVPSQEFTEDHLFYDGFM